MTKKAATTFQTLFPTLVVEKKLSTEDIFGEFLQKFPEFEIEDDCVKTGGEDFTMRVSTDMDKNLEMVFQASYVTYCPTVRTYSEFCSTPESALEDLAQQIKVEEENEEDVHVRDEGEDEDEEDEGELVEDEDEDVDEDEDDDFVLEKTKQSIQTALYKKMDFEVVVVTDKTINNGRAVLAEENVRLRIQNDENGLRFRVMKRSAAWQELTERKLKMLINGSTIKKIRAL